MPAEDNLPVCSATCSISHHDSQLSCIGFAVKCDRACNNAACSFDNLECPEVVTVTVSWMEHGNYDGVSLTWTVSFSDMTSASPALISSET